MKSRNDLILQYYISYFKKNNISYMFVSTLDVHFVEQKQIWDPNSK